MMGISSQCFKSIDKKCIVEDLQSLSDMVVNVPDLKLFISELTKDNRTSMPRPFINLSTSISNIYISRVSTLRGKTAYTFRQ